MAQQVKDPELLLQQLRSLLWHGFDSQLWNFYMLRAWPNKQNNKENFSNWRLVVWRPITPRFSYGFIEEEGDRHQGLA